MKLGYVPFVGQARFYLDSTELPGQTDIVTAKSFFANKPTQEYVFSWSWEGPRGEKAELNGFQGPFGISVEEFHRVATADSAYKILPTLKNEFYHKKGLL